MSTRSSIALLRGALARVPAWALVWALAAPLVAQDPDPRSAAVDGLFARWKRQDSPGAAVLVLHDGRVVHRQGYGMADLEHRVPIRPDTVFDIASVAKQFCGLAIAQLVVQGRVRMDDDVRKHIPWVPDFGEGRVIRIQHLVHHTSGLRDWPGALRIAGWRFDDVISFDNILDLVRRQRRLNFDPGSSYVYSNTGYNLLAHVVEKVTGVPFARWMQGQFFDPLGMHHTHFQDDHTRVIPNRATAYRRSKDGWHRVPDNLTALGSSSLFTTIDDLASWVANFETGKAGGAEAIARMHTKGTLGDGREVEYCFGVRRRTHRGLPTVDHTGSWAGFRTILVRYPEQRLAVVVLANTDTVQPEPVARSIAEIYIGERMQPAAARAGGAPARAGRSRKAPDLTRFAGRYRSAELDTGYTAAIRDGALHLLHFRNEDVRLRPGSDDDLFFGDRWWAGTVRFVRDAGGAVVGFDISVSGDRCRDVRFDRVGA